MTKKISILITIFLTISALTYTVVNGFDINNIEEFENKKIIAVIIFMIIWFIFFVSCIKFRKVQDKEGFYYREIPCNEDLYYMYALISIYNINTDDDAYNINLINAKVLEWHLKGIIEICDKEIKIKEELKLNNNLDKELLNIIKKSKNFNLSAEEKKELAKEIFQWMLKIDSYKINIIKNIDKQTKEDDANKIKGLRNYLKDYSYINEKNIKDVNIWEKYLVVAKLLGISEKIEEEMGKYIIQNNIELNLSIIDEAVRYLFNIS